MPIAYVRDDDRRRLVLTATGTITCEDAIAAIDRQIDEGAWRYGILYDIRDVEILPMPSAIFDILDYVRGRVVTHGPRGPLAILTTAARDEPRVRTYTSLGHPSARVATFTDPEAASQWLAENAGS